LFQNWSCNSLNKATLCVGLLFGSHTVLFAQNDTVISSSLNEFEVLGQIKPDPVFKNVVLDTSLIQAMPAFSIDQILKYQTNLYVRDYGSGALSSISFRGYSSRHTAVFWEDMPVTSAMNKTFDGGLFPTFMTEEVSIQYGAAGMINGSGGLGGTLKFNANPEFKKGETLKFEQAISTVNNASTGLMYRRSSKQFVSSTHFTAQYGSNEFSFQNPTGQEVVKQRMLGAENQVLSGQQKFAWKLKKNGVLKWNSFLQLGMRRLPHLTYQKVVAETQKDKTLLSNLNYSKQIGTTEIKAVAGFKASELQYQNDAIGINDIGSERSAFAQFRVKYWLFQKLKMENAVLYNHSFAHHPEYNGWQQQIDLQHIQQASYEWKQWLFHGLVKTQVIDDNFLPVLPSLGARWKSKKSWLVVKGNGAYHAMAPSLNDLYWSVGGNPHLKPEKGWIGEFSLSSERDTGFNYSITGFLSSIENRILWQPQLSGVWIASNVSSVTNTGIESSISYKKLLWNSVKSNVVLNYSYNSAVDSAGNQLAYIPEQRVSMQGLLKWRSIGITYGHRFTEKRFLNNFNTAYLPSFFNATAGVNYTLDTGKEGRLILGCQVENLYNEPYQEVANRPMPNRYFIVNIKFIKS
jgi:vitamin B12 transporter